MNIPLNIDWQQILLHLLNFVILAGGLYLLLYKPVKAFMEKRQQYYQEQDAKAAGGKADCNTRGDGLGPRGVALGLGGFRRSGCGLAAAAGKVRGGLDLAPGIDADADDEQDRGHEAHDMQSG